MLRRVRRCYQATRHPPVVCRPAAGCGVRMQGAFVSGFLRRNRIVLDDEEQSRASAADVAFVVSGKRREPGLLLQPSYLLRSTHNSSFQVAWIDYRPETGPSVRYRI